MRIDQAILALQQGKIIAYPTEGVFGLGCDPLQEKAVLTLLSLKQRPKAMGLICIASSITQLKDWMAPLTQIEQTRLTQPYPEPRSWLVPASTRVPEWIKGTHQKVAVRLTQHPVANALCTAFQSPIVSTSANIHGAAVLESHADLKATFGEKLAHIVPGAIGPHPGPTPIFDLNTQAQIR